MRRSPRETSRNSGHGPQESGNWLMTGLKRMYMLDSDHRCVRIFELDEGLRSARPSTLDEDARLLVLAVRGAEQLWHALTLDPYQ